MKFEGREKGRGRSGEGRFEDVDIEEGAVHIVEAVVQ